MRKTTLFAQAVWNNTGGRFVIFCLLLAAFVMAGAITMGKTKPRPKETRNSKEERVRDKTRKKVSKPDKKKKETRDSRRVSKREKASQARTARLTRRAQRRLDRANVRRMKQRRMNRRDQRAAKRQPKIRRENSVRRLRNYERQDNSLRAASNTYASAIQPVNAVPQPTPLPAITRPRRVLADNGNIAEATQVRFNPSGVPKQEPFQAGAQNWRQPPIPPQVRPTMTASPERVLSSTMAEKQVSYQKVVGPQTAEGTWVKITPSEPSVVTVAIRLIGKMDGIKEAVAWPSASNPKELRLLIESEVNANVRSETYLKILTERINKRVGRNFLQLEEESMSLR